MKLASLALAATITLIVPPDSQARVRVARFTNFYQAFVSQNTCQTSCGLTFPTVPTGENLIVEHVSCLLMPQLVLFTYLTDKNNSGVLEYLNIPIIPTMKGSIAGPITGTISGFISGSGGNQQANLSAQLEAPLQVDIQSTPTNAVPSITSTLFEISGGDAPVIVVGTNNQSQFVQCTVSGPLQPSG